MAVLDNMSYCLVVYGLLLRCGNIVDALQIKEKVSIQHICQGHTYGEWIGNYSIPSHIMCFAYCLYKSSCASFTFDEYSETCALNSQVLLDIAECDTNNIVYGQWKEYECETNGNYKLCGFRIYETPGQISGYMYVKVPLGSWATVCNGDWTSPNDTRGDVFCRGLGYSEGSAIYYLAARQDFYLNAEYPINMDGVFCYGLELELLLCAYFTVNDCNHSQDVYITCFL
ncbi:hypothetical protein ACF0H5_020865 [Mactra antiquata]